MSNKENKNLKIPFYVNNKGQIVQITREMNIKDFTDILGNKVYIKNIELTENELNYIFHYNN